MGWAVPAAPEYHIAKQIAFHLDAIAALVSHELKAHFPLSIFEIYNSKIAQLKRSQATITQQSDIALALGHQSISAPCHGPSSSHQWQDCGISPQ